MKYFSHKHKLHFLVTFEEERACYTLRHLMSNLMFWSFRFHTCLLSSVAFLYRSFRNEHIWFLCLNLNVVLQSPMYVSLVAGVVTSAWYTMFWALQLPSMGHVFGLRQLQFLFSSSLCVGLLISALLWLDIIVLMLFMQL